jgi:two-component system LytT family response regulator
MAAKPIRVMIVEDEAPARATMRMLLEEDSEVRVVGETWGARAVADINAAAPDLIFLDVRMPRLDGFQVLKGLEQTPPPVVVFVTAYEEHAVDAFEVRALDYVLKPFTDERFRQALDRAKERVRGGAEALEDLRAQLLDLGARAWNEARPGTADLRSPERIVLEDGSSTIVLPPARITWIEASGPYVVVHAEGREYLVRTSLTALEERLEERGFARVHRSAVVNLDHVREVRPISHGDGVIVLRDGTKVKVSRSRRAHFEAVLRGEDPDSATS